MAKEGYVEGKAKCLKSIVTFCGEGDVVAFEHVEPDNKGKINGDVMLDNSRKKVYINPVRFQKEFIEVDGSMEEDDGQKNKS